MMGTVDFYIQPGGVIGGVYQVADIIGQGYSAIILKCQDVRSGRIVAVKRFFPDKMTSQLQEKAYAEPKLNIRSQYVALGENTFVDNGYINMVMPFVEGESLRNLLGRYDGIKEVPAVYISMCIARACIDIHAARVLSTDIKPENIIVEPDGRAKLIDLTCFELIGEKAALSLGTAPYSCAELLHHDCLSEATDTFSIGVVLFEMLSGNERFTQIAEGWEFLIKNGSKPDISSVKRTYPHAGIIIDKALEPRPEKRYVSAVSLFNDLSSYYSSLSKGQKTNEKALVLMFENGRELLISAGKVAIGRDNINPLNCFISERHVEIDFEGGRAKIKDAGSRNGTLVNGRRLNGKWVNLHDTDIINIADVQLRVKLPQS